MSTTELPSKNPSGEETSTAEETRGGQYYRPSVDIYERPDELVLLADAPGAASDSIDVRFEDGVLTIEARVKPREAENREYLLQEYGVGDFYRSFRLSDQIDAGRITAEYTHGTLKLHLPKVEAAKARKIAVQSA